MGFSPQDLQRFGDGLIYQGRSLSLDEQAAVFGQSRSAYAAQRSQSDNPESARAVRPHTIAMIEAIKVIDKYPGALDKFIAERLKKIN